jgi:hypothetical protein
MLRKTYISAFMFLYITAPGLAQSDGSVNAFQQKAFITIWDMKRIGFQNLQERFGRVRDAATAEMNRSQSIKKLDDGEKLFESWSTLATQAQSFSERSYYAMLFFDIKRIMHDHKQASLVKGALTDYASFQSGRIEEAKTKIKERQLIYERITNNESSTFSLQSIEMIKLLTQYDELLWSLVLDE